MKKTFWITTTLLAGWAGAAYAQDASQEQQFADASNGRAIVVSATRTEQSVDDVPATVSIITAEEIEDSMSNDIKDLVRFEPGISVRSSPSRFTAAGASTGRDGNSGFNIRGLEGNRVLIQTDGIRLPDSFSFGAQSVGRGDYLDLDILKSVEILRGPASALYGSDGLAGAVSFITKDPNDVLGKDSEKTFGGRARAQYSSADDGWAEGVNLAARSGDWSGMVAYSRRDYHEQETQGTNASPDIRRTEANPQDFASNSILGKIVFTPSDQNKFRFTYEHYDNDIASEALSARAAPPGSITSAPGALPVTLAPALTTTSTLDLDAHDETSRHRFSFDHSYTNKGGVIDRAIWAAYYQQSENTEYSFEDRNGAADRTRLNTFNTEVWGLSGQIEKSFNLGSVENKILFGGDYSMTKQEGVRDGTVPPVGETFPTRAFPNTDYQLTGLFLQDEINLFDGMLLLYPALRYDSYELTPKPDAFYTAPTAKQSDDYVSPKFGLVAWPLETFGFYANYASGFKAPAPSQVNTNFTNPVSNYRSIPNPNLKPETSDSYEAGLRWRNLEVGGGKWSAEVTAFTADYKDFIDQIQIAGNFTALNPAVYQYINLGDVTISGFEGKVDGRWENGIGFTAAASKTRGDQTTSGVKRPLQSIDPWKLVAGLTYRDPAGKFGGQAIVTHSEGKEADRSGCTPTATTCFLPESFTIVDLTAYWNITNAVTLRAGAFNVTDEKYWWWGDVRGVGATSGVLDAYTQPGANYSASISYKF